MTRARLESLFSDKPLPAEESNAFPAHFYRDPAESVKFAVEKCGGCKYERIFTAGGKVEIGVCQKKKPDGSNRLYGQRCADYRERGTK